jgi:hypothetical protein
MKQPFTLQKYKWWELYFYKYKFIRKLSRSFWVKLLEDGYDWIKMDKAQFEALKFRPETKFLIEDYTNEKKFFS